MSGTDNSNREVDANLTEGIVSDRNYVRSNFEHGILGWDKFTVSTSGTTPYIIPTGSPTVGTASQLTLSANISNQIDGKASLLMTTASGADALGQGIISDAFTLARGDWSKIMNGSFAYEFLTGASNYILSGIATNTMEIWIWDQTNSLWIQPQNNFAMNSLVGDAEGWAFQSSAASATYRVAIIFLETFNAVSTVQFDKFKMSRVPIGSEGSQASLKVGQNTPQSTTTSIAVKIQYDNVVFDDFAEWDPVNFWVKFKQPGTYRVSALTQFAPSAVGTRQINTNGTGLVGSDALDFKDAITSGNTQFLNGTTTFQANAGDTMWMESVQSTGGNLFVGPNGNFYNHMSVEKIADSELDSLVGKKLALNVTGAPTSTLTGAPTVFILPTVILDTDVIYNPTTGESTVKRPCTLVWVTAVGVQSTFGTNESVVIGLYKNGGLLRDIIWRGYTGADFQNPTITFPPFDFITGDIVTIQVNSDVASPSYYTGGDLHSIGAFEVGSSVSQATGRTVAFRAEGLPTVASFQSYSDTAIFSSLGPEGYDTENAYNTTSGEYLTPGPGLYEIEYAAEINGTGLASYQAAALIRKNGTVVGSDNVPWFTTLGVSASPKAFARIRLVTGDIIKPSPGFNVDAGTSFSTGTGGTYNEVNYFQIIKVGN